MHQPPFSHLYPLYVVLSQILERLKYIQPCLGIRRQHVAAEPEMPEGSAEVFPSLFSLAERALDSAAATSLGHEGRWQSSCVRGFQTGGRGGYGVLGVVGGQDVLWSKACDGVAGSRAGISSVPRCPHCRAFWRGSAKPRILNALREDLPKSAPNSNMTSAQKVSRLPYIGVRFCLTSCKERMSQSRTR